MTKRELMQEEFDNHDCHAEDGCPGCEKFADYMEKVKLLEFQSHVFSCLAGNSNDNYPPHTRREDGFIN